MLSRIKKGTGVPHSSYFLITPSMGKVSFEKECVLAIRVAPDKTVADGLFDRVEYWDVTEGKVLRTLKTGEVYNPSGAKPLAFSDDGKPLACALENEVHLWETHTGDLKGSLPLAKTFKVRTASW